MTQKREVDIKKYDRQKRRKMRKKQKKKKTMGKTKKNTSLELAWEWIC